MLLVRRSFSLTAAGQSRIHTGFPLIAAYLAQRGRPTYRIWMILSPEDGGQLEELLPLQWHRFPRIIIL